MEEQQLDLEIEQLFKELENIPAQSVYDPTFDALLLSGNLDNSTFTQFPALPSLEDSSTYPPESTYIQALELENQEMKTEIQSLKNDTVGSLRTYLTELQPWMLEVTDALEKLGQAPMSATDIEFASDLAD
ncbi:hypothetical protein AKAW_06015 [Aspergillus luchuensis IFO 4308]|nr:hypothetical protein AKAW_06015 [Aspergillus luchuensis IFO 4308]